jgi:AraC-like DNA-binding protein
MEDYMVSKGNSLKKDVNYHNDSSVRFYINTVKQDYSLHRHTALEIIMPIDNIYTVCCNNTEYMLKEKDILIIGSCVPHQLIAPAKGKRYIILADLSSLCSINEFEDIATILSPIVHITPEKFPGICDRIRTMIYSIAGEYESDDLFRDTAINSKLMNLLVLIGRKQSTKNKELDNNIPIQFEYAKKLISICNYINSHFSENISLNQVADYAGFSKYHFSRLFRQYADISFYQYLNKMRILNATKLLVESDMAVMEVSKQCGYSCVSSFIRMFKIQKGCTPSEFRNMQNVTINKII